MIGKWIVGVDGSPSADAALRWAVFMARVHEDSVVPVGAWHLPFALLLGAVKRSDADRLGLRATAAATVDEALDRLVESIGSESAAGLVEAPRVVEGHPAAALLGEANLGEVLVVGRRGVSDLKHRLLGSVSQYLATHAEVPVVVVPESVAAPSLAHIVVGFDGSLHARRAVLWALRVAPAEATIRVVMAVELFPWLSEELIRERFAREAEAESSRLMEAIDEVDPAGRTERNIVFSDARQALAEASQDADVVVVGARGQGAIGAALLGSVATWLLHGAPCPVAVVP